jgi:hypothetical protein
MVVFEWIDLVENLVFSQVQESMNFFFLGWVFDAEYCSFGGEVVMECRMHAGLAKWKFGV